MAIPVKSAFALLLTIPLKDNAIFIGVFCAHVVVVLVCVHACVYVRACFCVCLAVKYYLISLTSSSGGTEPGSILLAAENCLGT